MNRSMVPTRLTVEEIAQQPRWDAARVMQLPGRCVGSLLTNWALHVRRRWGAHAEEQIREALGADSAALPSAPTQDIWLPVALQIRLTDLIIDLFLGGNALALEQTLWEDTEEHRNPMAMGVLRLMGPAMVLRQVPNFHRKLYDFGQAKIQVQGREVELTSSGSLLFENPTWQLLHLLTHRLLLRAAQRTPLEVSGYIPKPESFCAYIHWK